MSDATNVDSARDLRDNARGIKGMPAFAEWKRLLDEQIKLRGAEALNPLKTMEEALEHNYKAGEVNGLMHAVSMWDLMIEHFTREIELKTQEAGDEQTS